MKRLSYPDGTLVNRLSLVPLGPTWLYEGGTRPSSSPCRPSLRSYTKSYIEMYLMS